MKNSAKTRVYGEDLAVHLRSYQAGVDDDDVDIDDNNVDKVDANDDDEHDDEVDNAIIMTMMMMTTTTISGLTSGASQRHSALG